MALLSDSVLMITSGKVLILLGGILTATLATGCFGGDPGYSNGYGYNSGYSGYTSSYPYNTYNGGYSYPSNYRNSYSTGYQNRYSNGYQNRAPVEVERNQVRSEPRRETQHSTVAHSNYSHNAPESAGRSDRD